VLAGKLTIFLKNCKKN